MNKNKGDLETSRMPRVGAICNFNKYFKYIAIFLIFVIVILSVSTTVLAIKNSELKGENEIHIDDKVQLAMNIQDTEQEIETLQEQVVELQSEVETGNEALIEYENKLKSYETVKRQAAQVSVSYNNGVWGQKKTYMSFKAITNTRSKQYQLQKQAVTDPNTGVRMIDGDYCVAIGSGWGYVVGTKILVTLQGGKTFNAIVADAKANAHTNSDNKTTSHDGSVVEFIVDIPSLPKSVRISGTLSSLEMFNGGIVSITKR